MWLILIGLSVAIFQSFAHYLPMILCQLPLQHEINK